MNRKHITKVRDALQVLAETKKSPLKLIKGFYMADVGRSEECGTAGCLIGWSAAVGGPPEC